MSTLQGLPTDELIQSSLAFPTGMDSAITSQPRPAHISVADMAVARQLSMNPRARAKQSALGISACGGLLTVDAAKATAEQSAMTSLFPELGSVQAETKEDLEYLVQVEEFDRLRPSRLARLVRRVDDVEKAKEAALKAERQPKAMESEGQAASAEAMTAEE